MKYWYNGEQIRVFPNIEIWVNEDGIITFTLAWLKFCIDCPLRFKWK